MKFTLVILTMAVVAAAMAQEQQRRMDGGTLKKIILDELCSGHRPPIQRDANNNVIPYHRPTAQDIANWHNVSAEQMANILEEMLRENLSAFEKIPEPNPEDWDARGIYNGAALGVFPLIRALQTFHGADTIDLLKKSIMVNHNLISDNAIETYVVIDGVKSFPFFREVIKSEGLNQGQRNRIIQRLQGTITKLAEKKQAADVEQFDAFLREMKQTEKPKENGGN